MQKVVTLGREGKNAYRKVSVYSFIAQTVNLTSWSFCYDTLVRMPLPLLLLVLLLLLPHMQRP